MPRTVCRNIGIGRIDLDLAAQAVDLHVDRALVGGDAVAGEFLARHVVAGARCRGCVRISRSRSVMRTTSSSRRNSPRSKRNEKGPKWIDFERLRVGIAAPRRIALEDVAEPQEQLARLEGLRQVIVRADLETR